MVFQVCVYPLVIFMLLLQVINFSVSSFVIIPCTSDNSEFIANNPQLPPPHCTTAKMTSTDSNGNIKIKIWKILRNTSNVASKLETQQYNRRPCRTREVYQMPFVSAWLACFRFRLWGGVNCRCCGLGGEQGRVIILFASYDFLASSRISI